MPSLLRHRRLVAAALVLVLAATVGWVVAETRHSAEARNEDNSMPVGVHDSERDRPRAPGAGVGDRPNIVYILADDLDAAMLERLPVIQRRMVDEGTSFKRFYVTDSLCCPSRASILRGQYVHNHGVVHNLKPDGGYVSFKKDGKEKSTVASWLDDAGYRTALIGKYMNEYPQSEAPNRIPPGWDEWFAGAGAGPYRQFDYSMIDNGRRKYYGGRPRDYNTDVLTQRGREFISGTSTRQPFFMYLSPYLPHHPAVPAPRHRGAFVGERAPRSPAFNPRDMYGKPLWQRLLPRLKKGEVDRADAVYRRRLTTMLSVQDMVRQVMDTLRRTGQLRNTYIVFGSDNGFHLGQHRLLAGKRTAFDEDIHVPFMVRGPGVPAGRTVDQLSSTVDIAPTFAALAGADSPDFLDGRSLVPMIRGDEPRSWRDAVLIERNNEYPLGPFDPDRDLTTKGGGIPLPSYRAVRTARHTLVRYRDGTRELYDDERDPSQLHNIAATHPKLRKQLARTLDELKQCSGSSCRKADRMPDRTSDETAGRNR